MTAQPLDVVAKARKGLWLYFGALLAGTVPIEWALIRYGESIDDQPWLVIALMWVPALASLFARVILHEGIGDVSFRLPRRSERWTLLVAWLFPVAVGGIAYGIAWMSGASGFSPPAADMLGLHPDAPLLRFALLLSSHLTLSVLLGMAFTAGEEIGWRGYMLTRLITAGVPKPILVSGLIWGAWHVPLIVSGRYAVSSDPILSAALFMVTVAAASYLLAWVRLASGSVWPAIVFHASWNAVIQGVFDRSTSPRSVWLGESGLLVLVVFAILLICIAPRFRDTAATPRFRV